MSQLSDDPRFRNRVFEASSAAEYLQHYRKALDEALGSIDQDALNRVCGVLDDALARGAQVFTGGNGGSAAISEHLCCDWMKGTRILGGETLKVHCMTSNVALTTAIANDFGYEKILSYQLEMLAKPGDVVVLLSASGNSPNILDAARIAQDMELIVVGFSGFDGGRLAKLAHHNLHVNASNYGLVEDCHQAIMHILAQHLAVMRDHSA